MTKIKDIIGNISNVKAGTWVRLVLLVISLINAILAACGKTPVSVDYDELYTIVSVIVAGIVGIVSYWKNNSFTSAAQAADEYFHNQQLATEDTGEEITE